MSDLKLKEELALFFRSEYKELGLTEDFGAGYEGGRTLWNWDLAKASDSVQRVVEVSIYVETRVAEVRARVAPLDFKERYRTNEKVISTLQFTDKVNIAWLKNALQNASQFALRSDLLEVSEEDALPGTYKDTL